MKRIYRLVASVYLIIVLATVIYFVYYRLSNPELTETQLFLSRWQIVFPVLALGVFLVVLKETNQTKKK